MYAPYILEHFLIERLYMLVVSYMVIDHGHLPTTDTSTHVRHTIVVADSRVLIIGVSVTGLGSIPHHLVGILCVTADKRTTTRSGYHLVTIE